MLTINGRVRLRRVRWHCPHDGSEPVRHPLALGPVLDLDVQWIGVAGGLKVGQYLLELFGGPCVFGCCRDPRPDLIEGVDMMIVRELTGGIYFGKREEMFEGPNGREAYDTMSYTEPEVRRIVELAFQLAQQRRKKLTSVDKANVLANSRLWHAVVDEIAPSYPDVELEHRLVDSTAMSLITKPASFDVIVTGNMFGDILSDLGAAMMGSIGLAASGNINPDTRQPSMFEPFHGSAPDIAGQGVANPIGAIWAGAMMLEHLGEKGGARLLLEATAQVLGDDIRTPDLGGTASTSQVGDAVAMAVEQGMV